MPISFTDTFMTTDASGRISFDFSGHVHANGIDLDAVDTVSPPNDRQVRWLRTSDGAMIGSVYGRGDPLTPTTGSLELYGVAPNGTRQSGVVISDTNGGVGTVALQADGGSSRLEVRNTSAVAGTVDGNAGSRSFRVLKEDGTSSFARLPVLGGALICGGRISTNPGQLFTESPAGSITAVTRLGIGAVQLTFAAAAPSGLWHVIASPQASISIDIALNSPIDATHSNVAITTPAGAPAEDVFMFIAIG